MNHDFTMTTGDLNMKNGVTVKTCDVAHNQCVFKAKMWIHEISHRTLLPSLLGYVRLFLSGGIKKKTSAKTAIWANYDNLLI